MERKSRLPSISQELLRLVSKTLIVSIFLWIVLAADFRWWSIILFFGSVLVVYITQIAEKNLLRSSFWLFPLITIIGFWVITRNIAFSLSSSYISLFFMGLFLLFFFAFFLLIGISHFFFKDRFVVYGVFNTAVLLASFVVFFILFEKSLFWIFPFFIIVLLLFRESLYFFDVQFKRRIGVTSAVVAFLTSELLLVTKFMPLGILNGSIFLALFFLLLRDSLIAHFHGNLTKKLLLRQVTIFVFLTLIIFAISKWSL